jgi:hypothetical protein
MAGTNVHEGWIKGQGYEQSSQEGDSGDNGRCMRRCVSADRYYFHSISIL